MIKENQTIKSLTTQLKKAQGEYDALKINVNLLQKQSSAKKEEIRILENRITLLAKPKTLEVSEHAIVRYFERVLGFNIDEIKAKLLDEQVKHCVETLGDNGTFPNKENIKLVIKDKVVTTILE